ncbi:exportin-7 [Lissotriton helveticus]
MSDLSNALESESLDGEWRDDLSDTSLTSSVQLEDGVNSARGVNGENETSPSARVEWGAGENTVRKAPLVIGRPTPLNPGDGNSQGSPIFGSSAEVASGDQPHVPEITLSTLYQVMLQHREETKGENLRTQGAVRRLQNNVRRVVKLCNEMSARVLEAEGRISAIEDEITPQKSQLSSLETLREDVNWKLVGLENRSRWNNMRILGIPEGSEGSNVRQFVIELFSEAFPELTQWQWDLEFQRAHRFPFQQKKNARAASNIKPRGNYVLNYLATRPKLAAFVTQALIQLYARITKLGWFDCQKEEYMFRNVIVDVTRFLQDSVEHCIIGVTILSQLTNEINQADTMHPLTKHRKIASSFRDSSLFDIFTLSCNLLKQASGKTLNLNDESQHGLLMQLLKLTHNCLNFDFIGTSTDESSDDLCTVQIPTSWRSAFLDSSTLQLFFDLYHSIPPTFSPLVLSCLVQVASVRRSLFNNAERAKFLSHLVDGVKRILENPQSLSDPNNYHEFCRLLARLKSNYQLGELVKVENYPEVIRLIANFTVTSLQHWEFAPNSVHYLLSLWQRLAASVPYVKATEPHMLETYTPEVTKSYITSRLESVHIILRDGLEDPLDDTGLVQQQLDQLSTIGRCEYEKTCALLVQLFDQSAQTYQELLQSTTLNAMDITVQEGRLTWLVYIIGAVIGGRVSFASTDEQDAMDGELVCRVLQLMNLTDSRLAQAGNEKLELAMLSFFEQFRKIYIGDQVQKSSKLYRRLSEVLGLNDETMVLSVFIGKIITNLKYWGRCEPITSKTLQLLNDLSIGYSSVRKLVKLSAVQFMLNNHTSEHFSFLGINNQSNMTDMRCRTTFYTALGRLLMVDLGEDEDQFEQFMLPLTAAFEAVAQMFGTNSFNEQDAKRTLVGLVRDLRGIAFAFNAKTSFMMLFEWIYPSYMPILQRAIELWFHDPACTTPVLKLMAELVHNRSQRLQFDVSSPNGILLFRETSKMVTMYGNRVLTLGEVPKDQLYALKLKGISICFSMLKAALSGSYVNFGVFRLYGDDALDNALQTFIKLLLSIPHSDLLDYPKLSQSYYSLLEVLTQDHMNFIASLEPHVIMYILSSISEGLTALDTMVCTGCCSCLDHIVTYLFKQLSRSTKKRTVPMPQESDRFLHIMQQHPEMIQQMLSTVLNIIIFEDCRNQWSMSRPLLGLILLNEKYFSDLRNSIVNSQPPEKQQAMHLCFENLMEGIERNLLTKNRDRFTQNLSAFRREVNDSMKNSACGVNSNDMMS